MPNLNTFLQDFNLVGAVLGTIVTIASIITKFVQLVRKRRVSLASGGASTATPSSPGGHASSLRLPSIPYPLAVIGCLITFILNALASTSTNTAQSVITVSVGSTTAPPPPMPSPSPLGPIGATAVIIGMLSWVYALIMAARIKRWGWFVGILFSYIIGGLFFGLLGPTSPPMVTVPYAPPGYPPSPSDLPPSASVPYNAGTAPPPGLAAMPMYWQPGDMPQPALPSPGTNLMAIISLITGITSVCFAFASLVPGGLLCGMVFGFLGCAHAIIFGHIALRQIAQKRPAQNGQAQAISGLVTGYFALALLLVSMVLAVTQTHIAVHYS